jgi:hypothetical protein
MTEQCGWKLGEGSYYIHPSYFQFCRSNFIYIKNERFYFPSYDSYQYFLLQRELNSSLYCMELHTLHLVKYNYIWKRGINTGAELVCYDSNEIMTPADVTVVPADSWQKKYKCQYLILFVITELESESNGCSMMFHELGCQWPSVQNSN